MVTEIPDSLSCFLDSKAQDSAFHKQNFPEFRIIQAKTCRIPESGVPYTRRVSRTRRCIFILYPFFFRGSLTYRGYYMPARGYEFYLRVFNSISHSGYRVEHERIQFVSTSGLIIFCLLYRHRWRDAVILFFYRLRLKLPWQPWYLHMWRIKIVSSLDTKFSSLEKSWYSIGTCISLIIKMMILETLNSAK